MKLSREEELFLRHWMYDEVHYQKGAGAAKGLQVQHQAVPADLAILVAAAIPDPKDQEAAGQGPPPTEPATWPWSPEALRAAFRKPAWLWPEAPRRNPFKSFDLCLSNLPP